MNPSSLAAIRTLLFGAALIAGAGCQHVERAPIDATLNAQRLATRSLADPAVQNLLARHQLVAAAPDAWSLDQLTLAAWALRTDLAVARAEVDAARAAAAVDGQRPNPVASGSSEKVVDANAADPWVIGAALALTLETGGKREIRHSRALAQQRVLELQFGQALWVARAEVRAALLDLGLAQEQVAVDDAEVDLVRAFLAWVDARLARGAATTSERLTAVQSVNESISRRGLDAAALTAAAATLAAAIGVAPHELANLRPLLPPLATLPAIGAAEVGAAREAAIVNRLDVRRALADYDVVEEDLRAAVAAQYPDVVLAPGYAIDRGEHKITLGLDLPVPLFHNANAAIGAALAARTLAAAKFDDVQAAALAAINVAFARYESSRAALAAVEQAERDAEGGAASLERRLAAGAANRGELLAAQITLARLRHTTLAARRAVLDAVTALENGIERPLYPPSAIETTSSIRELLAGAPP